ncbi:UDP-4-amino-4,6-dideoxy-N-acetyl-beta-L-altrosamine N-acetyltransferase [Thiothrix subterranea]|uniref:UDP-4-amino-4, 6-dideoxy-N-acetyl-beta-L-altrosamine N-acetyltransferase n=1 Tax=Thiothrix subterranea TaxID=2735563 RepID=UPI00192AD9D6|nr:UDP-4-amino-4,6-dideoxy-N-acetyl-beta-L-altrosamine N-acetyltransferase [Thiothrix subterranea]QQZ29928.1 UDP-4-amino-4,6-dideoxy-N-acetyl-beta-L-altrosamine N-acetyltransferase [Thiothrix subterranea]
MQNTFGLLRNIEENEIELMLSWRNHPTIRANMYNQHEITIDEHVIWWNKVKSSKTEKYFLYELKGVATGIVGFNNINKQNNNSSWAFYASPEAAKGTGTKMEFLALEYAFNILNLHKLYCEVLSFNSSVIKLHKKFGFSEEGIFREQYCKDNHYINIHRLGLLKAEWTEKKDVMKSKIESFK